MSEPIGLKALIEARKAEETAEQLLDDSFDAGALNTNIEQRLNDLEVQYEPRLSGIDQKVDDNHSQVTSQLAQTNKPLRYGPLEMPSDFKPELPTTFYRDNDGIIKHNMDFQSRYKNGTKLYVRLNGDDTTGDGSPAKPFRKMAKAVAVAIGGSDSQYVIVTNIPVFNRGEFYFNQTVVNKTISFVSENSYEESSKVETIVGLTSSDYDVDWEAVSGYIRSFTEGSSLTKNVKGSDIYLKFRKYSNGGVFKVVVDGKQSSAKQFSTHSDTPEIYEELIFWDLEDGNHQVTITYVGPDPDITYGGTPNLMLHEAETFRAMSTDFSRVYKWSKDKSLITSNDNYSWTDEGNGVFTTTRSSARNVIDLMNIDIYGMPIPLKNAENLSECQNTPNTWYSDGPSVWVHRKDGLKPSTDNTVLNIGISGVNPKLGEGGVIYFENFIFTPWITAHALNVTSDSTTPVGELVLNNCLLVGQRNNISRGNGLATDNIKNVFSFDTITAYAQMDGYNYHYTKILEEYKRDCLALEYNCTAYDLGLDVQGAGSNNASSSHEGASVVRFGTVGYRNTGATIIDVNGCYSVLYDCHARTPMVDGVRGNGRAYSFTTENTGRNGITHLINSSASDSDTSLLIGSEHVAYISNFKHDGVITVGGELVWE